MAYKVQLCWDCKKACGDCSWSDGSFTPITGWVATPVYKAKNKNEIYTYHIYECPEFEKED